MKFIETRGNDGQKPLSVTFSEAILNPMSSYGGIYAPESLPDLGLSFLEEHLDANYKTLAFNFLKRCDIDISDNVLEEALSTYDAFDDATNPAPLVKLQKGLYVNELYHGPTRAFKDMALQPFGVILSALAQSRNERYLIMAATSGDTGPAALDTFRDRKNVQVACMYPSGGTSDVQRLQMTTESAGNLKVIGIHGNFDDAQSALKKLLSSDTFRTTLKERKVHLSAANSVNFGRIIFQIIYHIWSYLELVRQDAIRLGDKIYLNVPSGNFGNALGGYYAMKMGLPVEKIIIASNKNNVLTQLINEGQYDISEASVVPTTSPAMDILKSSNVERVLFDLYGEVRTKELMLSLDNEQSYTLNSDELNQLREVFAADYCEDEDGQRYIQESYNAGYLMDPHTATCLKAHHSCRSNTDLVSVMYSTAEWTKFSPIIATALGSESPLSDEEALDMIAEKNNIKVPSQIHKLFTKEVTQNTLVDKVDIESTILDFINKN